jgi:D-glycero-D-manno-heptose 1,7-bisphosphate phosphatase
MSAAGRPGIVLDRDGTLIDVVRDEETGTISVAFHPNQLRLLPGVVEGLLALSQAGFLLSIATNQPGAAKGQCSRSAVERTNSALLALLADAGVPIAALEVCLHHPEGGPGGDASLIGDCTCRKPKPGMLLSLIAGLGLDPARSWMIGDSRADLEAAEAASLGAALVFSPERCELCPLRSGPPGKPQIVAPHFDEVARRILTARGARG